MALLSALALLGTGVEDMWRALWWPATGLAVALAVRRVPQRAWVGAGAATGTFAGTAVVAGDPASAATSALVLTAIVVVTAELTARLAPQVPHTLQRGRDAWVLALACLAGIACGTALLAALRPDVDVDRAALGQCLGIAIVTPLLLLVGGTTAPAALHAPVPQRPAPRHLEGLAALLACTATAAAVFWSTPSTPWSFLVVVPVLWAAARTGPARALLCLLVVAVVASAGTRAGTGPYAELAVVADHVPALQALLLTASTVALVVSLVVRSRDRAVQRAQEREELFRRTFDHALLGVALLRLRTDGSAVVARINDRAAAMLGGPDRVPVGSDWAAQVWNGHRGTFVRAVRDLAAAGEGSWHGELRHGRGDTWLELAVATWPAPGGGDGGVPAVVQVIDCTQRRTAQRRLRDAAMHDHLTGLPNRSLLQDRLRHALGAASRSGCQVALLYCDLDDFKPVNDTGGHAAGDQVLVETAARLASAVRPGDTVARLGGDEFAVVCPDLPDEAAAYVIAHRVVEAMRPAFEVAGWRFEVGVSVGVALAQRTEEAHRLLQAADEAMYRAKRGGKGRVRRSGPAVLDLRDDRRAGG